MVEKYMHNGDNERKVISNQTSRTTTNSGPGMKRQREIFKSFTIY